MHDRGQNTHEQKTMGLSIYIRESEASFVILKFDLIQRTLGSRLKSLGTSELSRGRDHLSEQSAPGKLQFTYIKLTRLTRACQKVVVHGTDKSLLIFVRRYYSDFLATIESLFGLVLQCLGKCVTADRVHKATCNFLAFRIETKK